MVIYDSKFPLAIQNLSAEPVTKLCTEDSGSLHALVKRVDAHMWSDVYVLERQEEDYILWEVYYVERRECIYLRALERCHRKTRQAEVIEKRGKIQRRTHFQGMTINIALEISVRP